MSNRFRLIIGAIAALVIIIAAASLGSSVISFGDTVLITLHKVFRIPLSAEVDAKDVSIVWLLRLPRVLLAFLVGGCLAMSGAVCQSILRNPLASPYILGVSSGASLGAGIIIVSGITLSLLGSFTLPLTGFIFGLATVFIVASFSSRIDKSMSNNTIILVGMVFSLFLNALLTTLSAVFSDDLRRIALWQMGSFAMRGWTYIYLLLPFFAIGTAGIFLYTKEMDILSFGDEQAKSAGVETASLRKKLLALCAVLTGASVALSGVIGFVDLIAPHAARRLIGSKHKHLIPMSFILGGSLMVLTDLIARTVISPSELPVGAITALIGAPFFAWVYFRGRPIMHPKGVDDLHQHGVAHISDQRDEDGARALARAVRPLHKTIEVRELSAGYGNGDVIRDISFKIERGESLCLLGANGCGKSTLLRCIARIIDYRGSVLIDGVDTGEFSRKELAKKIALLSQNMQVFFPYTVYETVSMGRYAYSQGFLKNLSAEDITVIEDILKKLDIWDIKERMIDELSGGTLQRVFLAKTLAQTPDLILLDEPANHLDLKHQLELLDFLKLWVSENNKTLIGVFHDLNLARRFADTALVLDNGNIVACGKIDEILKSETLSAVYGLDIRAFYKESLTLFEK